MTKENPEMIRDPQIMVLDTLKDPEYPHNPYFGKLCILSVKEACEIVGLTTTSKFNQSHIRKFLRGLDDIFTPVPKDVKRPWYGIDHVIYDPEKLDLKDVRINEGIKIYNKDIYRVNGYIPELPGEKNFLRTRVPKNREVVLQQTHQGGYERIY